jgi:hypothetical protein
VVDLFSKPQLRPLPAWRKIRTLLSNLQQMQAALSKKQQGSRRNRRQRCPGAARFIKKFRRFQPFRANNTVRHFHSFHNVSKLPARYLAFGSK